MRLGHARRDRADAGRADQLHADARDRIDLLQIVDELRQILDRIDVVMRRRGDQRHPRRRVAQLRDEFGHLEAGQLPALTRLGALRDLDLDLVAGVEIFGGDAEPARGDLLHVAELALSPFGIGGLVTRLRSLRRPLLTPPWRRSGSSRSPASRAPRALSAPSDMPGVTKRLRISVIASTLVDRHALRSGKLNWNRSRRYTGRQVASTPRENCR